jgi:hypothetical protein
LTTHCTKPRERRQQADQNPRDWGHGARHLLGIADRVGLRQHLGEDHHQRGHDQGGVGDTGLAGELDQNVRGQRSRQDVEQVVAEQQRPEQPLLLLQQAFDHRSPAIALAGEMVDPGARGAGHRRLSPRGHGRATEENNDGQGQVQHVASRVRVGRKDGG